MLKIAICDDEQPIREYLKRLVEKCTEAEVSLFADGVALLADPTAFDLILLDISLNQDPNAKEPNGMETARKIRERSDALIIFVSALREYVFEGYDVGAFHYLLKPIDEQKFTEVMDRAIRQIRSKKNAEPLVIKVGATMSGFLWMISSMPRTRPEKLCCTPSQRRSPTVFMKKWKCWSRSWEIAFSAPIGDFL